MGGGGEASAACHVLRWSLDSYAFRDYDSGFRVMTSLEVEGSSIASGR